MARVDPWAVDPTQHYAIVENGKVRNVSPQEISDYRTKGFNNRMTQYAPYIVGGVMTAGTLQSAGYLPGGAGGAGTAGATTTGIAPGVITNTAPSIGATVAPTAGGATATGIAPGVIANSAPSIGAATAPAGASSMASSYLPYLISGGSDLAGAYMQSRAANNAAKTQAASADKALAFAREVYNQQQANSQPWLQAGQGAVSKLSSLMGIGGPGGGPISQPANQASPFAPGVMPRPGEGDPSRSYYRPAVTLIAPDGNTRQFDEQQAAMLMQKHPELRRVG